MAGKYQAYPEYKDSGEEWLGSVPSHWEVIQIKHLSVVKRGASPRPIDDAKYFDDEGEYAWTRIADVTASDVYLTKAPQRLSKLGSSLSVKLEPESLFLSIAGTVGKPCITGMKACIHDGFVYFPELKIPSKFLFYVFAGEQAYKGLGKFGTQLNLNTDTVGGIKIGCTENSELQKIVNFLDHETAKIDTLIAKQQRLIELLKEKRQAVISHAVTKGLNTNVPMRNSGVEWLGEVPEHWVVMPIKRMAELNPKKSEVEKEKHKQCNFVPMEKLKTDSLTLDKVRLISDVYDGYTYFKDGDVLMAKVTPCFENKNIAIAKGLINGIGFGSSEIYVLRVNERVVNDFLYYRIQEDSFMEIATSTMTGAGGLKRVPAETINNFTIALPTISEQKAIVTFIKDYLVKFDALVVNTHSAISLLNERRTALISAAVTGKIDVRNFKETGV